MLFIITSYGSRPAAKYSFFTFIAYNLLSVAPFLIKTTARLTARSFYDSLFLRHPKACPDASLPSVSIFPPVYAVGPLSPLCAALCSPNGSLNSAPHYIRQSLGLPDCLNGRHQLSNRTERIVSCYPLRHGCISLFSRHCLYPAAVLWLIICCIRQQVFCFHHAAAGVFHFFTALLPCYNTVMSLCL